MVGWHHQLDGHEFEQALGVGKGQKSYGRKSWTMQKAERGIIDAFELVLEKTLESPLDCKEIQPVYPNGNQS